MTVILAVLMIAAAEPASPTAEALALGREMAEVGTLATLLPMIEAKETEELVAEDPDLSDAEREALRVVAREKAAAGREKLLAADARAYAEALSVEDLRALVAFSRTDAARHYRARAAAIASSTMRQVGDVDFKAEVRTAFCATSGKLCPAR